MLLPPANEVAGRLCFYTCLWFCSCCSWQVSAPVHAGIHTHPGTRGRHPPRSEADTPQEQTPPGTDTPQSRHPDPKQTPSQQIPPGADTNHPEQTPPPRSRQPPTQCMLGDTGNKRAVRILLECILVNGMKLL